MKKNQKRILIVGGSIAGVLFIALLVVNAYLSNIIETQINKALQKDTTLQYQVSLENVSINLLSGNVRIKGIKLLADSVLLQQAANPDHPVKNAFRVEIPVLRLVGIRLYRAVTDRDIKLRKIEFRRAKISLLKGQGPEIPNELAEKQKTSLKLDSLTLNGIAGISIGKIEFSKCAFELIDIVKQDTSIPAITFDTEFSGFTFDRISDTADLFAFNMNKIEIELKDEEYFLPGGHYKISLQELQLNSAKSMLRINGFRLKPLKDKYKIAQELKYTGEIFDIDVKEINLTDLDTERLVDRGELVIGEVNVTNLDLAILMDKRYPFNERKRPKLPHQLLKSMAFPIYMGNINIHESSLKYQEKMPEFEDPMTVLLEKLMINIKRATSIPDSLKVRNPMKINLNAKLMGKANFDIEFVFPLYTRVDTFYYAGSLGKADFSAFNAAAFPALGIQFKSGNVNSINFRGSANNRFNKGEFTMLYDDLTAEVSKKDYKTKSKFWSWAANTALHKSNPGKNGKTRIALMSFDRVMYKGFGNFMWKTFQNGIISTVTPAGKTEKRSSKDRKKK